MILNAHIYTKRLSLQRETISLIASSIFTRAINTIDIVIIIQSAQ